MKNFKIVKSTPNDAAKIIDLFKENYTNGYYNSNFQSVKQLENLISRKDFTGITVWQEMQIIGFSGIYTTVHDDINIVYLAHFLIDQKYRHLGLGQSVDSKKNEFIDLLPGRSIVYSILGINSLASLKVKEKSNYDIWGVRLFYGEWEPNQDGDGHLIVVGKLIGCKNNIHKLPCLNQATETLIKSCNIKYEFLVQNETRAKTNLYTLIHPEKIEFGQCLYKIRSSTAREKGYKFEVIIKTVLENSQYPYLALRLPLNLVTKEIETILYANSFFPTSFIPFLENCEDVLDYQYIPKEKANKISDFLSNKQEILEYINKKER